MDDDAGLPAPNTAGLRTELTAPRAADAAVAEAAEAAAQAQAHAEVLLVALHVRSVTDQQRAKVTISAGACAGADGSFGRLRKSPRGFDYGRRYRPLPQADGTDDADPR